MASDTLRERNRQNAQHSTGPRTAAGKARSSRNALKHGFTGTMIASKADRQQLALINRELCRDFAPANALEGECLNKLVWSKHQGNRLKIQLADTERLVIEKMLPCATNLDAAEDTKLSVVRDHAPDECRHMDLLRRYARQADRDWDRSARTLVWLQTQRKKEDRAQLSWEREEERKARNSRPDLYSSAYHSMTRRLLEDNGIDPSVHASKERDLQRDYELRKHEERLATQKQQQEELEDYLDQPDDEDDNEEADTENQPENQPNEPTKTPPNR